MHLNANVSGKPLEDVKQTFQQSGFVLRGLSTTRENNVFIPT